jgi:lipopolysaccharide transport system ATP-binding protein
MVAVEIDNVSKRFRRNTERPGVHTLKSLLTRDLWRRSHHDASFELVALSEVSASIKAGTTFGIIGRNGSGKSTLLKLITRIYKPDAGEIRVKGRVAALIELGAGFHPELTGRENILINGIILGLSRAEIRRRTDSIIAFAELEDFIDDPVRTYSSGMYMRLGFSVAVNVDPEILLIDEVLAVGDLEFTRKCKERMNEFRAAGKTIVLVTHDVGMAGEWCDQAMWLDHGSAMKVGAASEVVKAYVDACNAAPPG